MISNHPVAGSMKQVIANNCNSLTLVEPSSCLTLALTVQVPIRSHITVCHGSNISASLGTRCPY